MKRAAITIEGIAMKRLLAATIIVLITTPTFAGSRDYIVGLGARYCEFTVGQKPPVSMRLLRTYKVYPEGPDFHLTYNVYRACNGQSKVAVLVEGSGIDELRIQQHGICLHDKSGHACIGDTVQNIQRSFPALTVRIADEEGLVLTADVTKNLFLTFDDGDLGSPCESEDSVGCKSYVKSRHVKEIVLRAER